MKLHIVDTDLDFLDINRTRYLRQKAIVLDTKLFLLDTELNVLDRELCIKDLEFCILNKKQ